MSAAVLVLAIAAGHTAICAGWLPTPEARMACCADESNCPMHAGDGAGGAAARTITQAEADSCCAAAEREPLSVTPPFVLQPIAAASWVVSLDPAPVAPIDDLWRTFVPLRATLTPRHLLLAVLIV